MKKIILLFFMIPLILASCQKEKSGEKNIIYEINEPISSIEINWDFGKISFINSETFQIEEKTNNNSQIIRPLSYEINGENLTIHYGSSNNNQYKDLIIYYKFSQELNNVVINGKNINVNIQKSKIINLIIESELIIFAMNRCTISSLLISSNGQSYPNHSTINNSKIEKAIIEIAYGQIDLALSSFNLLKFASIDLQINLSNSLLNELDIYNLKGSNDIWLNGNTGFNMNLVSKTYEIDFETLNYNNKYYYLDGSIPINIYSKYGDTQIRRFFA